MVGFMCRIPIIPIMLINPLVIEICIRTISIHDKDKIISRSSDTAIVGEEVYCNFVYAPCDMLILHFSSIEIEFTKNQAN